MLFGLHDIAWMDVRRIFLAQSRSPFSKAHGRNGMTSTKDAKASGVCSGAA